MNFGILAKRAGKIASDNSPAILTALGVTGTLTAVFLTGKASFKAAEILAEAERNETLPYLEGGTVRARLEDLTFQEKTNFVWKLYVPAAGTAAMAVACIVGANHVGTRRAAALASAYTLSEKAFVEYKGKVLEKLGEKKEQTVRDEIAQDRVRKNPPTESTLFVTDDGFVPCLDTHSGRYFKSTRQKIDQAVIDTNFQILHEDYASVSDFWERVGLAKTASSDEIGWNTNCKLDIEYATAMTDDGKPCLTVGFRSVPVRSYDRFR